MNISEQNILFMTKAMGLGGTENVVMQLCEIFGGLANKVVVVSNGGGQEEKLAEMGIKHYLIPDIEDKSLKTLRYVSAVLKRIIHDEEITVIHTHHRMAAFYVRALGLYKGRAFFNTSHNTFDDKRLLTKYALSRSTAVACGEAVGRNLTEYFGLKEVSVIHNAVRPFSGPFVPDPDIEKARKEGKKIIGNVGRLSKQKAMEYYVRAIPAVLRNHPEASFYIVGDGVESEKLRNLSAELKASVTFMGYRQDVQNVIGQMDLIVLSSLWEGLPLTPIEAFSVSCPVVATDVEGTCEIVTDGLDGLIVPKKDPEAIAEAIIRLLDEPALLSRMKKNAYETYVKGFSFDAFAKSYIDLYRNH